MAEPIYKYRDGSLTLSVWENKREVKDELVKFKTFMLQRSYKDADDNWQNTGSLNLSDLPKAIKLMTKAYLDLAVKKVEPKDE